VMGILKSWSRRPLPERVANEPVTVRTGVEG